MKTIKDDIYEDLALEFQHRMLSVVDKVLINKGIDRKLREDICGDIVFDLCALFDGESIAFDSKNFWPELAFRDSEQEAVATNLYINAGVVLHESVYGCTSDYFENYLQYQ